MFDPGAGFEFSFEYDIYKLLDSLISSILFNLLLLLFSDTIRDSCIFWLIIYILEKVEGF